MYSCGIKAILLEKIQLYEINGWVTRVIVVSVGSRKNM